MASACCCIRRCAASNCGSASGRRSRRNCARWSKRISQTLERIARILRGLAVVGQSENVISVQRGTFTRPIVAVAMVALSSLYAIAQQSPVPSRVRGTIEGVDGDVLAVKSRSGQDVKLHMTPDVRVAGITRIALADIKVGSFIGTTTVPGPDGGQKAIEVHVFPESMRGT